MSLVEALDLRTKFSHSHLPPREIGMTWSIVKLSREEQYLQRLRWISIWSLGKKERERTFFTQCDVNPNIPSITQILSHETYWQVNSSLKRMFLRLRLCLTLLLFTTCRSCGTWRTEKEHGNEEITPTTQETEAIIYMRYTPLELQGCRRIR